MEKNLNDVKYIRMDDYPHGKPQYHLNPMQVVNSWVKIFEEKKINYILGVSPLLLKIDDIIFLKNSDEYKILSDFDLLNGSTKINIRNKSKIKSDKNYSINEILNAVDNLLGSENIELTTNQTKKEMNEIHHKQVTEKFNKTALILKKILKNQEVLLLKNFFTTNNPLILK